MSKPDVKNNIDAFLFDQVTNTVSVAAKRISSKRSLKKLVVKFVMHVTSWTLQMYMCGFYIMDNIKCKKLGNYCSKSRVLKIIINFVVRKKFKAVLNYYNNNNNIIVYLMSKSKFFL